MKIKFTVLLLTVLLACSGTASCSKGGAGSSKESSSAGSDTAPVAVTTDSEAVTERVQTSTQETSAAASDVPTTAAATEKNTEKVPDSGYTDSLTLAKDFYQAYLDHEPEKVYNMFNQQEIECYKKLMTEELDGKSPDEVFSKDALIKAIDDSMSMIEEIMAEYSNSENDRWNVDITEELFEEAGEEELTGFNKELGTDYTAGLIINYMYYVNDANGEVFVGNSSAFLEKNGQWYVSFSSLMQSELINQIEV